MKTNLLITAITFLLSACSHVNAESTVFTSDVRHLGNFYGIIVNTNANVIISQGEATSVKVEGELNQINDVSTIVSNGALVIGGSNNRPVTVYVTVDDISLIEVNGNAKVYANQPINSDIVLLKVNGNGSIKLDVRALSLGMIVKGNGKIMVSGSTGESFVRVYGRGNVYAQNLDSFKYREELYTSHSQSVKEYSSSEKHAALRLHE